jgi:chromosome segregation ATPase
MTETDTDQILTIAIDALQALRASAAELAGLETEVAKAKAVLDAAKAEHEAVSARLADDGGLLEQKQRDALQAYDKEIFAKVTQLRQLQGQCDAARANLADLQSATAIAKTSHDEVTASLAQLRRRIGGH